VRIKGHIGGGGLLAEKRNMGRCHPPAVGTRDSWGAAIGRWERREVGGLVNSCLEWGGGA